MAGCNLCTNTLRVFARFVQHGGILSLVEDEKDMSYRYNIRFFTAFKEYQIQIEFHKFQFELLELTERASSVFLNCRY